MQECILEMKDIHKSFSGVKALSGISLSLRKQEILGLCGENGAGKSTLMKILSGIYPFGTYDGNIFINGKEMRFNGIKDAEAAGIAIIHQELNLIPEMNVTENLFLGNFINKFGILDKDEMYAKAKEALSVIAPNIDPESKIKDLGTGEQQMVEIAKAILKNANILIFDEPTSSLTEKEISKLIEIIFSLKENGLSAIYISHKLDEIEAVTDSVEVIRDGKSVGGGKTIEMNSDKIISMMVGRSIENLIPRRSREIGDIIFEAKNYTLYDKVNSNIKKVDNASFYLREREILGFSGLVGSGRTELLSAIYGAYSGDYIGESYLYGKKLNIKKTQDAVELKIGFVPEERKTQGVILNDSVQNNIVLSTIKNYAVRGVLDKNLQKEAALNYKEKLSIKIPSLDSPIKNLSGGNQQKCVLAKSLLISPKILILDEPTRGIDVGAKYEIYQYIFSIVEEGCSVILISSELPEILGLSDRVIVMHEGKIKASLDNNGLTQEIIMTAAIGE
ncbi:ATP-binding cassette domain-containing protein [Brachyspira pilosicoli]|uniref:Sugar ABC transporter ATP-binding protein n=1 Tax=Brachyspira pilosicoli TaxID=52584 RepID=A0AAJ6KCG8_BRAPL|nr:ATP-binding cassette domain-containing protein [Brachyspira pilosicoli]WIH81783.1 sugar ABC transporter ATP-binding protein [Brachyspira pilosicoli]WIH86221.1 sugar ABC transporter ATP-binding protein [Brachyspira pilosicoli]WIH88673.1 sugar ABC transporter ATP-binding protein [Brachyspira pilosicoli]WIH90941.1 sugar ABC transporter ATP-binding protein [Brachyspira pilosicoli]WIH93232.1 sugar ABC transporter ATP-binding protein [Brachyspira pilosicoli]